MTRLCIFIIFITFTLSACVVGPEYVRPDIKTHDWIDSQNIETASVEWWKVFNDPVLVQLIDDATNSNLNIASAQTRVKEARALRKASHSKLLPTLGLSATAARNKQSLNDPRFIQAPGIDIPQIQDSFDAGFDVSWEIDIFGGNRRSLEAADARIEGAKAFSRDVLISTVAETARNYFELRGNQNRLNILQQNIVLQAQTVELVEATYRSGLNREIDFVRAQRQLANTKSQVPNIEAELRASAYRLAVLTGQQPGSMYARLKKYERLPVPDEFVPIGLKSDLLRRRPDIQMVERNLAAATADVGVAVADFYPSFSLTGTFGLLSENSAKLFDNDSQTFLLSPFMRLPIFQSGRLKAQLDLAKTYNERAVIEYKQIILSALEETERALIRYSKEQETRVKLLEAVRHSKRSAELANKLFEIGLTNFIDVLNAERELTVTEDALVQSETRVITALIILYKSLGGGWEAFHENN